MSIAHVIFDGFGTLVERQRPMSFYAHARRRTDVPIDWQCAMTATFAWEEWARSIGRHDELLMDLENVVLFKDIPTTIRMLVNAGVGVSVMSNLASCYGLPLQKALASFEVQHWFLSYRDGMKKPDSRYYQHALDTLGLQGRHVLFVGDHAKHDVMGPALSGLNALRVRREIVSMNRMLEPWC